LLECKNITKKFGGLTALKDVSLVVREKEIVGLIGPNGSGKTTLFNVINGFLKPEAGDVLWMGEKITGRKPHKICQLGIARVFQNPQLFSNRTVLENVITAVLFKASKVSKNEANLKALRCLEFVGLRDVQKTAKDLTLHEERLLEIARALATEPKLLLLDEVMSGLNLMEMGKLMKLITKIRDDLGITILWVEHVMRIIMQAADRIIVLHHGEKIADGKPIEIAKNEEVIKVYLGYHFA
jgi:branched-chain amino acid transport system ATP-binding protein